MPVDIASIEKDVVVKHELIKKNARSKKLERPKLIQIDESKDENVSMKKDEVRSTSRMSEIHQIPMSRHKKGQFPFTQCEDEFNNPNF